LCQGLVNGIQAGGTLNCNLLGWFGGLFVAQRFILIGMPAIGLVINIMLFEYIVEVNYQSVDCETRPTAR
jgi:hypothetical protein